MTDARRTILDNDTEVDGVGGPFKYWESDHTGLVHVLWSAKHRALTLEEDADEIASRIMHSRWLAAARAEAATPRELRFVTSLNRAPADTVIRSEQGGIYEKTSDGPGNVWRETGSDRHVYPADIALPAAVIYDPSAQLGVGPQTIDRDELIDHLRDTVFAPDEECATVEENADGILALLRPKPSTSEIAEFRARIIGDALTEIRLLPAYGVAGHTEFDGTTREDVMGAVRALIEPPAPRTPRPARRADRTE